MTVTRRLRFEILKRDNHTCRYCGGSAPDVTLHVDHVIPTALGGGDDPTNLVTACKDCNAGKASTHPDDPLVADVDAAAFLMARALDAAADLRRQELGNLRDAIATFDAAWTRWTYPDDDGGRRQLERDHNWQTSIARFLEQGLRQSDFEIFIEQAMHSRVPNDEVRKWRMFCKLCWNELTERQELARRLIEDGQV